MCMPASNNGDGGGAGFPDVKATPVGPAVAPIPYPNTSLSAMSATFSPNTFVGYLAHLFLASIQPITLGNQAGVAHPLYMQAAGYTLGHPRVWINCLMAICLGALRWGNLFNNPLGAQIVPSITATRYSDGEAVELAAQPLADHQLRALRSLFDPGDGQSVGALQLDDGVALVVLRRFASDAATRFYNALRSVDASRGLVLDLRGNPGGDCDAALEIAGELLPEGAVLGCFEEHGDRKLVKNRYRPTVIAPVVVWIDGHTASAAELVAACLKHHGRARLLGEKSYGKGSAQTLWRGPDGRARYDTVALTFAPDGSPIDGCGVCPHDEVRDPVELYERTLAALAVGQRTLDALTVA